MPCPPRPTSFQGLPHLDGQGYDLWATPKAWCQAVLDLTVVDSETQCRDQTFAEDESTGASDFKAQAKGPASTLEITQKTRKYQQTGPVWLEAIPALTLGYWGIRGKLLVPMSHFPHLNRISLAGLLWDDITWNRISVLIFCQAHIKHLHLWNHSVLSTNLWDKWYSYPHSARKEMRKKRVSKPYPVWLSG